MENGKNIKHTSRHCGRGPAIQAVNKENTFINRLDPGSMSGMTTQKAFTLVELLVVVLIIGVLSAIAIPMYQGAVDKSHWSTMLPGAKAIKDAEEAIKMTNGSYTDNMANLDVTMNNADLTFALLTPNNTADPNVIRVTNNKLNNVRLASYLDDNPKFAGQLHCEALKNDERANRLCGKLLMGQELTEQDGYVGYLLDQEITKDICGNASRSWSSSKTKCYKDTATRCSELGMGVITGLSDQCGYNGGKHTIGAEGMCYALNANSGCANSTISEGGVCKTEGGHYSCPNLYVEKGGMCIAKGGFGCPQSTFNGGICVGNADYACSGGTFTNHSICYANNAKSFCDINHAQFKSSYDDTSCCCGAYCGNAPVCPASKCAEALEKINASGYL